MRASTSAAISATVAVAHEIVVRSFTIRERKAAMEELERGGRVESVTAAKVKMVVAAVTAKTRSTAERRTGRVVDAPLERHLVMLKVVAA